jgi:putative oxidoreductase
VRFDNRSGHHEEETMSSNTATAPATHGRALNITLWAIQILLALAFVSAGAQKLAGTQYMVHMFGTIGAGQWLRYAVGLVEIAGAVGLLLPPLSGTAALGLVGLMVGATITNLFIGYSVAMPLVFLVVAALIVWGRPAQTIVRRINR